MAGGVRHGLAQDAQQGLARLRRDQDIGRHVEVDLHALAPRDLLGGAGERRPEGLVVGSHEGGDGVARVLQRALRRVDELLHHRRSALLAGHVRRLLHDERQLLGHAVVQLARDAAALVADGGDFDLVLGVPALQHTAEEQHRDQAEAQHVGGDEPVREVRGVHHVVEPREGAEDRRDREAQHQHRAGARRQPGEAERGDDEQRHEDELHDEDPVVHAPRQVRGGLRQAVLVDREGDADRDQRQRGGREPDARGARAVLDGAVGQERGDGEHPRRQQPPGEGPPRGEDVVAIRDGRRQRGECEVDGGQERERRGDGQIATLARAPEAPVHEVGRQQRHERAGRLDGGVQRCAAVRVLPHGGQCGDQRVCGGHQGDDGKPPSRVLGHVRKVAQTPAVQGRIRAGRPPCARAAARRRSARGCQAMAGGPPARPARAARGGWPARRR